MPDAITVVSDMKVYHEEFQLGFYEALFLNSQVFNAASNNAILLITEQHRGEYIKNAYFKQIASLIERQNLASTASVDSKKLEQVEEAGVKLHRRIGPVQYTFNAFDMVGLDTPMGSMALGRLVGDALLKRMASSAIISLNAAVAGVAALVNDVTGQTTKTPTFKYLNQTRGKWGDQMAKLAVWLLHSTPFINLVDVGIDTSLDTVAGVMILRGSIPGFLNAGVLISDNENLVNSGAPDTYNTLGLAPMASVIRQSGTPRVVIDVKTGFEQLVVEFQGEYTETVSIDGFTWDTANGGANPDDSTLGTSSNWDQVRTDTKGLPIVKLLSQ